MVLPIRRLTEKKLGPLAKFRGMMISSGRWIRIKGTEAGDDYPGPREVRGKCRPFGKQRVLVGVATSGDIERPS